MKFFPIRERFMNFLLQEKIFSEVAKSTLKKQWTSSRRCKISPANRSEALIEFRKDEESIEKTKEF